MAGKDRTAQQEAQRRAGQQRMRQRVGPSGSCGAGSGTRRSKRRRPTGAARNERTPHEAEVGEGRNQDVVQHRRWIGSGALAQRHVAGVGMLVPGLGHGPGAQQVLGRQHALCRPGCPPSSRASSRLLGKSRRNLVEVVQHADHSAVFGRASARSAPSGQRRSWRRSRRTARPAAPGQRPAAAAAQTARAGTDRPTKCRSADVPKPPRPTASMACWAIVDIDRLSRAEAAKARPAAEQHGVEHRDREGAIDLGLLRQVGNALGRAFDAAPRCAARAPAAPQERALPAPLGPTMAVISPAGISADT